MTQSDTQRIDELEKLASDLQAIVGTQYIGKSSAELKAALTPEHTLPGGRYPLFLSDYQIRVGIAEIDAKIPVPQSSAQAPAAAVSKPVATGPTMPPLSASQIATLSASISRADASVFIPASIRDRIKSEVAAGIYSQGAREVIDPVKLWRYSAKDNGITITPDEDAAIYAYLQIIDQRQKPEDPNATLLPNDPRWVRVAGSAVATAPITPSVSVSADLLSQLTAMGFEIVDGRLKGLKLRSPGPGDEGFAYGYLGMDDGALRAFYNIVVKIGSMWPDFETNSNLPVIMGPVIERDGGISRDLIGSGKRKTHVTYLAGRIKGGDARTAKNIGKWVDEVYWEDDRGVRFSVFLPGGNPLGDILPVFAFDAQGVIVRAGNQLRRLVVGADGRPDYGEIVSDGE